MTQSATKKDIKELLQDFGKVHEVQFKLLGKRFDKVDDRFDQINAMLAGHHSRFEDIQAELESIKTTHADHYAEMGEKMDNVEEKINFLLINPELQKLKRRVSELESNVFGKTQR